jgi:hypothetical protein
MSNGIYQAIATAMSEIEPIAKEKRNKEQGFQYRGVDDIMNQLSPILVKNKIFIYPEVINVQRQERTTNKGGTLLYSVLTIKYHFAYEDGSEICCVVIGEGMDSGDKASNKAMAVAFKYACLQMFCIPTDDMPDPDATTPEGSVPKQQTTPTNSAPRNNEKQPQNGIKTPQNGNLRGEIIEKIGAIMKAVDPNNEPFFTKEEVDQERAIAGKADVNGLKNQLARLEKDIAERQAAFDNDVPWGQNNKAVTHDPEEF